MCLLKHRLILLFFLAYGSAAVYAGGPIGTLKLAFEQETTHETYVSAGYPHNHSLFRDSLQKLWDRTTTMLPEDGYKQIWKEVPLSSLREIFGNIPEYYVLISPLADPYNKNNEVSKLGYRAEAREVTHAALFKWSCEGSIIPVVSIGPWPRYSTDEWGPVAVSVPQSMGKPTLLKLDTALVPATLLSQVESPPRGLTLSWPNQDLRAALLAHSDGFQAVDHYWVFAYWKRAGFFSVLEARPPFDFRC